MASMNDSSTKHRKARIGPPSNTWFHSTRTGFDLTHFASGPRYTIQTVTSPITISPSKSALVIIDMQNFFLSPSFGRSKSGVGHRACQQLISNAIPAARRAGMRIIWLNWGLTEDEVMEMPPAVSRAFGFEAVSEESDFGDGWTETDGGIGVDKFGDARYQGGHLTLENGKKSSVCRGLGSKCGDITLEDGKTVDAGRLLMRDTWNAALYQPLNLLYEEGRNLEYMPDVWIHKNRMSGLWGARTDLEGFLEQEGIRTLFFSGVNTDQCVGGTLTDAFSKGYDCILLSDGCATTSPEYAQQCFEYNAARTFGFCTNCEELKKGTMTSIEAK